MDTFVYLLRGQGGLLTSPGVDYMASEITRLGLSPRVYDWNKWMDVVADIITKPVKSNFVVEGFSLGGNATTWIEEVLKTGTIEGQRVSIPTSHEIALLLALDPSTWTLVSPLLSNVRRAVLFHDVDPLNPVGHAEFVAGTGFDPHNLIVYQTYDLHLFVDLDPWIQQICLAEIKSLLARTT